MPRTHPAIPRTPRVQTEEDHRARLGVHERCDEGLQLRQVSLTGVVFGWTGDEDASSSPSHEAWLGLVQPCSRRVHQGCDVPARKTRRKTVALGAMLLTRKSLARPAPCRKGVEGATASECSMESECGIPFMHGLAKTGRRWSSSLLPLVLCLNIAAQSSIEHVCQGFNRKG